jgi:hypothetical protein
MFLSIEALHVEVIGQFGDRHPDLLHAVAIPNGHGLIVRSFEVDRHAERRADFVLSPITFTDGSSLIEGATEPLI